MRITLKIDSATTAQLRDLQQSFHGATVEVAPDDSTFILAKVNGPEHWTGETPPTASPRAVRMLRDMADRIERAELRAIPAERISRESVR